MRPRISALFALGLGALAVWGFAIEPARLVIHRERLEIAPWPVELDGLRVVALSDLHVGAPHMPLSRLSEIVARTNALEPDLIVLLGDFLIGGVAGGSYQPPVRIAAPLAELRAPLGVFAVLGNHDWWKDGQGMRSALIAAKITVLEDETRCFDAGARLCVTGLADLWTRGPKIERALAGAEPGAPILLLSHSPDVFPKIPARVSVTLAGHTHGGQVSIPFYGPPWTASRFGRRYAAGSVVEGGRHLFVTTGIGTSILPVRFGVPPEIAILDLHPASR